MCEIPKDNKINYLFTSLYLLFCVFITSLGFSRTFANGYAFRLMYHFSVRFKFHFLESVHFMYVCF
nr:MAG TPA: hypothetical protein [Caudoviricetes sp.]